MRGTLSDGRPTRETRVSHVGPEGADWPCLDRLGPGAQAARHEGRPIRRGRPAGPRQQASGSAFRRPTRTRRVVRPGCIGAAVGPVALLALGGCVRSDPPGRADVSRQPRPSPSHREVGRPGRRGAIGVWLGRSVRLLRAPRRPSRTPTRPLARPRRGRTIRRPAPLAAALLGASRPTAAPRLGHLSARSSCHPPRFGRSRQSRPSALGWCRGVARSTAIHRMAMRALTRHHPLLSASVLASGQTLAVASGRCPCLVRSPGAHRSRGGPGPDRVGGLRCPRGPWWCTAATR